MTLFSATIFTSLFLLLLGSLFLWNASCVRRGAFFFLRSKLASFITFGTASVWFLWYITRLGEADFGNIRQGLFLLFLGIAIFSFLFVRDFLSVRGAAVLMLLVANLLLRAAYMQIPLSRLFLVSFVYFCILLALYLAVAPFRLRDFFSWLFAKRWRPLVLGMLACSYGILLMGVALTY